MGLYGNEVGEGAGFSNVKQKPIFIAAGLGRCGTSLVTRVLAEAFGYEYTWVTDLDVTRRWKHKVFKTHDYAPARAYPGVFKFIYLFGNPMNIACSVDLKGQRFVDQHYLHLHSDPALHPQWQDRDTMKLAENLDSWHRSHEFDLLTLRYETLFDNGAAIEEFVEHKIVMPEFRNRKANWEEHSAADRIGRTYAELNETINRAEDARIWRGAPRLDLALWQRLRGV